MANETSGADTEYHSYKIEAIGNQSNTPKCSKKYLQQSNSVYDLPSTEEAIKLMHAVCGYPVKSTWLKAVKAGNYSSSQNRTSPNITQKPQKPQKGT